MLQNLSRAVIIGYVIRRANNGQAVKPCPLMWVLPMEYIIIILIIVLYSIIAIKKK